MAVAPIDPGHDPPQRNRSEGLGDPTTPEYNRSRRKHWLPDIVKGKQKAAAVDEDASSTPNWPRSVRRAAAKMMNRLAKRAKLPKDSPPVRIPKVEADGLQQDSGPSTSTGNHASGRPLHDGDIPRLRGEWTENIKDLTCPIPEVLPPFREINHELNLIDEDKQYHYHNPRCPDHFVKELGDKITGAHIVK